MRSTPLSTLNTCASRRDAHHRSLVQRVQDGTDCAGGPDGDVETVSNSIHHHAGPRRDRLDRQLRRDHPFPAVRPQRQPDCGRRLDPLEALVGTIPTEPEDALQDTLGLPNDGG